MVLRFMQNLKNGNLCHHRKKWHWLSQEINNNRSSGSPVAASSLPCHSDPASQPFWEGKVLVCRVAQRVVAMMVTVPLCLSTNQCWESGPYKGKPAVKMAAALLCLLPLGPLQLVPRSRASPSISSEGWATANQLFGPWPRLKNCSLSQQVS